MTDLIESDNSSEQTLIGACDRWKNPIKTYDDAFGPLWVYCTSMGVAGVIRAQSWEAAWEIVEDQILAPIPEKDVAEAYGFWVQAENPFRDDTPWYAKDQEDNTLGIFSTVEKAVDYCREQIKCGEHDLVEGYSYQPNATGTGIVMHDLSYERLDRLTVERARELEITVEIGEQEQ